jgi:lysophospholipase L1-like esterase
VGMIRDIANRHGIQFLDYSSDTMCRDTKYFYNSQHLNTAGAELFSARLAEDLAPLVGASTASAGDQQ